jgi:hypothetical protein
MSRKRSPLETLEVIERSAEEDEAERILALSDEDLDHELAAAGFDPRAVRAKGEALAEKLGVNTSFLEALASGAPASKKADEPSVDPAAWVTQTAPSRLATPAARWAVLLAAALAAAATGGGVLYALAHRPKPNDKPVEVLPQEVPTVTPPVVPAPQDTSSAPPPEPRKRSGPVPNTKRSAEPQNPSAPVRDIKEP